MDIRILVFFLCVSVAGSFADLRSPLFRSRRNGLQEPYKLRVMDFDGVLRTKRESGSPSTTKSTATSASTSNPSTPTLPSTDPRSTSTKEPDPTMEFTSDPTTSFTPESSSTTGDTPKPSPTSSKTDPATPSPSTKPTMPNTYTTVSSPNTKPTSPVTDSTTPSLTTNPATPTAATTTSSPNTKPTTSKSKSPSSKQTSPPASTKPTEAATTPKKPENSGESTGPASTTPSPAIGSRFGSPEDKPEDTNGKPKSPSDPNQSPKQENPTNPELPFSFPTFFMPPFVPNYSPFYPRFSPDAAFNTIPTAGNNNPWAGPNNAAGVASSFASAGASAGASDNSNHNAPVTDYYGGYPNDPNIGVAAPEPNVPNMPNMINSGGYGNYEGDTPFYDFGAFAFPGYNYDTFQKQMEENFRQMQAQLQKQQQSIFEATNRIASDGASSPGAHTAYSSINLGPGGGYQTGAINPAAPGIQSRFAEELPPPSGNNFGVFSSSMSHSQVDPSGKTVSRKVSTTGVNDNGKITFRTVHD